MPVFLAPMAGFTDAAMRRVCHQFGAALTYTEMVNASGVLHDSDKTWHLLETFPDEGPVVAHLYGAEPAVLGDAAACVAQTGRFVAIDLNAGCPMRKITSQGAGAALIAQPELVHRIVASMKQATTLPITVKTRIGKHPDKIAVFELLDAVSSAGGDALAVHGRFASQEHSGDVRLDLLAEIKRISRIPIIGNGGIYSANDARLMFQTGVDAIMIARAATGNPWIFPEIKASLRARPIAPLTDGSLPDILAAPRISKAGVRPSANQRDASRRSLSEIRQVLEKHMDGELELLQRIRERYRLPPHALPLERAAVATFRCHLFRYLHGLRGSSYVRGHLNTMRTMDDIRAALDGCFQREANYRAHAPASAGDRAVVEEK